MVSRNHQVVKRVRRLRRRTYRDRDGIFLVEGLNLLQEAMKYGAVLEDLLFVQARSEEAAFIKGIAGDKFSSYVIDEGLLGWMSDVVTSQGILAVVDQVDAGYTELMAGELSLLLVADQVRDPGNLGALMRIADAAGADGFLMTTGCVDAYNSKVVRAAAGSHFHIPFVRDLEFDRVAQDLTGKGVRVLGLDARGAVEYLDEDLAGPVALVVGNEAFGIDEGHADKLHDSVFIRMPGRAESLNVASAAAVVLFEALRQRRETGGRG